MLGDAFNLEGNSLAIDFNKRANLTKADPGDSHYNVFLQSVQVYGQTVSPPTGTTAEGIKVIADTGYAVHTGVDCNALLTILHAQHNRYHAACSSQCH